MAQDVEQLDGGLIEAVRSGKAVLFLGAGASLGARAKTGKQIPSAPALKKLIADRFLGPGYDDADFKTAYDYAASASNVRELQLFLHEELTQYDPAPFHMAISEFAWAGLATTNYDLVVERVYRSSTQKPLQELITYCQDDDRAADNASAGKLLYVKLHGCISRYQSVSPPLVASTEQIIHHRDGRNAQFAQFLEWAQIKTIVFVGYSLGDANLRALFDEIVKEGDNRPRHYFVRPGIKAAEQQYWSDRRVRTQSMSFEQFLVQLSSAIPVAARQLALFPAAFSATTFTKFISVTGRKESAELIDFLRNQIEHVSTETAAAGGDPKKFYQGFDLGWFPFDRELDAPRHLNATILNEQVLPTTIITDPRFVVLKAHAGAGKSVCLRRMAWDAGRKHGRLVFFATNVAALNLNHIEEIVGLVKQTIYLIIDDVADVIDELVELLKKAKRHRWPIIIIGGARVNEWNVRCEELHPLVDDDYDLKYLTQPEIASLLVKLEENKSLGYLASVPRERRADHLKETYGRQLLVALHEATKNKSFRDIIKDEFNGIQPEEAKLLYLDVCSLHRFGPPVRAGLIGRVHGIRFEEFQEKFFLPLEQVIDVHREPSINDWVYKARHSYIAQIVYEYVLTSVGDKFDNIMRIVSKLNGSYSYDREVLFQIIRAHNLSELFKDRARGEAIYDAAMKSAGREAFILQQRGIYEMRLGNDMGAMDRAEALFREAKEINPHSPSIRHSLSELALKRSMLATDEQEKIAWRRQAEEAATILAKNSPTPHAHHTLAKAAIASVKDAFDKAEAEDTALSQEAFSQAVKAAEDVLRGGLQRFPNEPLLLNEEATLGEVLQNADRTLQALKKAFEKNDRSELIGRRLARVLKAKGQLSDAIDVLRKGLEHNPGNQVLNYDMAQAIRASSPDADVKQADIVLYHLQRSFTPGDKNFEVQYWYARQLCICGQFPKAKALFEKLRKVQIPLVNKRGGRGQILGPDGNPATFYGVVTFVTNTYGFIRSDWNELDVFFSTEANEELQLLEKGDRLSFRLGFTLLGPNATHVSAA